jgi:hypothetical protein
MLVLLASVKGLLSGVGTLGFFADVPFAQIAFGGPVGAKGLILAVRRGWWDLTLS